MSQCVKNVSVLRISLSSGNMSPSLMLTLGLHIDDLREPSWVWFLVCSKKRHLTSSLYFQTPSIFFFLFQSPSFEISWLVTSCYYILANTWQELYVQGQEQHHLGAESCLPALMVLQQWKQFTLGRGLLCFRASHYLTLKFNSRCFIFHIDGDCFHCLV